MGGSKGYVGWVGSQAMAGQGAKEWVGRLKLALFDVRTGENTAKIYKPGVQAKDL